MSHGKNQAFTLFDISILLVVAGLLAGGVVLGLDFYRSWVLRGDLSQLAAMDRSVELFRQKFNCIPGDCRNASIHLTGANDGDGNGLIQSDRDPDIQDTSGLYLTSEMAYFNDHLARAQLISINPFDANNKGADVAATLPLLSSGNGFVVRQECVWVIDGCENLARHTYRIGVKSQNDIPGGLATPPAYTPKAAHYIDQKIDDGKAYEGLVTAAGANSESSNSHKVFAPVSYVYYESKCTNKAPQENGLDDHCDYDLKIRDKTVGLFIRPSGF